MADPSAVDNTRMESAKIANDEDRIYEEIQAPKFFDFSLPDRSPPDDSRSWFCARIGCNQQHEEVDQDALYKNFVLRVLAARSPNVRFQKALRRQAQSGTAKCPRTAPVKSAKDRIQKFSTIAQVPDKIKSHPISSLRSTPVAKAKKQPTVDTKPLTTTPRIKKCTHGEETLQQIQKNDSVPKSKMVAKGQVLRTPNKVQNTDSNCHTPISEMCSGMKKLHIGSQSKHVARHLCKTLKDSKIASIPPKLHSSNGKPLGNDGDAIREMEGNNHHLPQEGVGNDSSDMEIDGISRNGSSGAPSTLGGSTGIEGKGCGNSLVPSSTEENNSEEKIPILHSSLEPGHEEGESADDSLSFDDNKENSSTNCARELNSDRENIEQENHHPKTTEVAVKTFIERSTQGQGRKYKKNKATNPKPFRLRTDERSILKEANLERRRFQLNALKEIMPAHVKSERSAGPSLPQRRKQNGFEPASSKPQKMMKLELLQKPVNSPSRMGGGAKKVPAEKGPQTTIQRPKEVIAPCDVSVGNITMTPPLMRKPTTIPKEPNFHRLNVPRSCCTKRSEKENS